MSNVMNAVTKADEEKIDQSNINEEDILDLERLSRAFESGTILENYMAGAYVLCDNGKTTISLEVFAELVNFLNKIKVFHNVSALPPSSLEKVLMTTCPAKGLLTEQGGGVSRERNLLFEIFEYLKTSMDSLDIRSMLDSIKIIFDNSIEDFEAKTVHFEYIRLNGEEIIIGSEKRTTAAEIASKIYISGNLRMYIDKVRDKPDFRIVFDENSLQRLMTKHKANKIPENAIEEEISAGENLYVKPIECSLKVIKNNKTYYFKFNGQLYVLTPDQLKDSKEIICYDKDGEKVSIDQLKPFIS